MSLAGEIDLYTAPRLHAALISALAQDDPVRIVVDMSGVEFCDSTGMSVLLAAQRRAREVGGDVELAAPRPAIRKILQVTGLESVFTVLDDAVLDDAVLDDAVLDDAVLDDAVLDGPVLDGPVLDDTAIGQ
jgi:anti-sigma B factor antagonist